MTWAKRLGLDERRAVVRGVRMRYYVGGRADGPALVLAHGLSGAASNWVSLAPLLANRCRLFIPDLPGHGGSAPVAAAPSLDAFADRLLDLAALEGMDEAVYVGHSLGGTIALRAAIRRPAAVAGLVLLAAAGIGSASKRAENAITLLVLTRPGRAVAPFRRTIARLRPLRRPVFGYWEVSDTAALSPEATLGFLEGPSLHTDVAPAAYALVDADPRQHLERIRCPRLVLWGAEDKLVPLCDGIEYARRLRSPLRVIPDCGHLLIGERPEACADAVLGFLHRIGQLDELPG